MYKSLEALRIVAAILVVTAHMAPTTVPFLSWFLGGRVFLGSIGVDVFFIISGIVMGLAFQKRANEGDVRKRMRGFLAARVRKVFPLYIVATLVAVLISPLFGRHFPALNELSLDLLLLPHMTGAHYADPVIGAGWTLRYEIFFYLAVFAGLVMNRRHWVTVLMITVAFGCPVTLGYYSNPLLLEFLAGYLLASRLDRLRELGSLPVRLAGFVTAAALFLLATTGTDFPPPGTDELAEIPRTLIYFAFGPLPRVIVWGVPSLLLVMATASLESQVPRRLAALGKYTYSLYLMQYFCLPIEHKLLAHGQNEVLALAATIFVLVIVTAVSYVTIERPLSTRGRGGVPLSAAVSSPKLIP